MRPDVSEEEAIRTIVREGTCADYTDIADAVQQRFGLRVGAGRVEAVVMAMKQETPDQPAIRLKTAGIKLTGEIRHETEPGADPQPGTGKTAAGPSAQRDEVLKFVESMGGFDAARAAIADLEQSLRNLMK